MFCVLLDFKFTPEDIKDEKSKILTYHRIIEAMKFAYARRPSLGDPDFINRTEVSDSIGFDFMIENSISPLV